MPVLFEPSYIALAGDTNSALVLSQLVYWFKPGRGGKSKLSIRRGDRYWLAKSRKELAEECGLTERQVKAAMGRLRDSGIIVTEVHLWNNRTTPHIWVDMARVTGKAPAVHPGGPAKADHLGPVRPSGWTAEGQPYSRKSETTAKTTAVAAGAAEAGQEKIEMPAGKKIGEADQILKNFETAQAEKKKNAAFTKNSPQHLAIRWKQFMADEYDHVVLLKQKEVGQIGLICKAAGEKAPAVMFWAAQHWGEFAFEAKQQHGLKQAPDRPNLGFLLQYLDVAIGCNAAAEKKPYKLVYGPQMGGKHQAVTIDPGAPKTSPALPKAAPSPQKAQDPTHTPVSKDKVAAALAKFQAKKGGGGNV